MIQDIVPLKLNNAYHRKKPGNNSRMLGFIDRMIYLKYDEKIEFLTYEQWTDTLREQRKEIPACVYLFSIGEEDYFLTDITADTQIEGFAFHKMFSVRTMKPMKDVLAAATAWHLYVWYRDNQFCGRCGTNLTHDTLQRMMRCPKCGNLVFPKIAPAVIIGLTDGDKILMTKYAGREYKRYALIAGFTEIGETAEETVAREVMEEVGLKVKNIRYYKSQPWGFDSNLLLGYFCDLAEKAEIQLEEEELSLAEWVDYKDVPDDPEGLSLTREMMVHFRESRKMDHQND